ncbi:hypothetical protein [Kitasatospora sp. NBC_00315]|uniref:hypothetical protein n=1 Tax=Kitasatospora sp. NBC_00315 TaxID=2975963 RepID=UPI0032505D5A
MPDATPGPGPGAGVDRSPATDLAPEPDRSPATDPAPEPRVRPLGVAFDPTGHPGTDAALARLKALDGVPAEAHVPVYEDVHQRLGDILAALDRP